MELSESKKTLIHEIVSLITSIYQIDVLEDNISDIVHAIGGNIEENTEFGRFSDGLIKKVNPEQNSGYKFAIVVSAKQSEKLRRFEIARNLGHLFLHMHYPDEKKWCSVPENAYYRGYQMDEIEVDEFAYTLLMPEGEYLEFLHQTALEGKVANLTALEKYFKVSADRIIARGENLNLLA